MEARRGDVPGAEESRGGRVGDHPFGRWNRRGDGDLTDGSGLAAQHSHSLEGWYAHIPGIKLLSPATLADARGMLGTALEDPDPVLIFEPSSLYPMKGELPDDAGNVDIDRAAIRRPGKELTLITYGASLGKALDAAEELSREGIEAEVIDLRTLRPLDDETFLESVSRTHRALVVDEGWRSGSLSAEISARIMETSLGDLGAETVGSERDPRRRSPCHRRGAGCGLSRRPRAPKPETL